jgi:hypothetical protein
MTFQKRSKRRVTRPVKVDSDTHNLLKTLSREISEAQNFDVSMGETVRRNLNIPNSRDILIEDARIKRRLRR